MNQLLGKKKELMGHSWLLYFYCLQLSSCNLVVRSDQISPDGGDGYTVEVRSKSGHMVGYIKQELATHLAYIMTKGLARVEG